jgi:G protein beta subunit-like protein
MNTPRQDMSVILVTGSYDHEIRFWEAWSGICSRTIARSGESGVSRLFLAVLDSDIYHPSK